MAGKRKGKTRRETESDPKTRDLECFLNQPNINMVIPWIYDIYKNMATPRSRDGSEEDKVAKDLECFLNQPNINMTIPWIYQIYKSVKEGGGSGGDSEIRWDDRDLN
jgi:hypothetical protein